MGSTPTRVTARWGRLWPAAALSVGLRCPRRAIAGQDPEHTTRRWSVMATRLPAKQHQAGSIPVDVSRDESHNHVPWSNGTTPVRHTGNDGSIIRDDPPKGGFLACGSFVGWTSTSDTRFADASNTSNGIASGLALSLAQTVTGFNSPRFHSIGNDQTDAISQSNKRRIAR